MTGTVTTVDSDRLHERFLDILPRVETHARIHCHGKCPSTRDDQIAEAVALAWSWYLSLARRGIDAGQFPSALATYAVKAVGCGRRLAGMVKRNDLMDERAQKRNGFIVETLPVYSTLTPNPLSEALIDNTVTPPDEQAAFRIDFLDWFASKGRRDRRLIGDMAMGERTKDLAARYGLCPARISQKRSEFRQSWRQYTGES